MLFNRFICRSVFFIVLFSAVLLSFPLLAQEEEEEEEETVGERPSLQVSLLSPDFRLDGIMDISQWQAADDSIEDLITIEPEEGGEPEGQTIVKVFASQKEIVVVARCFDDEPDRIVSFMRQTRSDAGEMCDNGLIVFEYPRTSATMS